MHDDLFYLGVKALIRNEAGKILLLKVTPALIKNLPGFEGQEIWDIPGGRIQRGETPHKALLREVKDEINVSSLSQTAHLCTVISNLRIKSSGLDYGLIVQVFSCFINPGSIIVLNTENTTYKWVTSLEAAALLRAKYPPEFTDLVAGLK
jgi:ADP-ribose pyrophosphatase YjhB (NUDIX family)